MKPNMTNEEFYALYPANRIDGYLAVEDYHTPTDFEHRVDPHSSLAIYAAIRNHMPKTILQIGSWMGGTTGVMMAALKKNGLPFRFVCSELLEEKRKATREHMLRDYGIAPEMVGDCTTSIPNDLKDIDCFFHDTDHDLETTDWVIRNIFPRLKPGALVIFHDWAVQEINGKWVAKEHAWAETEYMIKLHEAGRLGLQKVYWNYKNPANWELGIFLKEDK